MNGHYVIYDSAEFALYKGNSDFRPWIFYSFTKDIRDARFYASAEEARAGIEMLEKTKYAYDGITPIRKGRLEVREVGLLPVA